MSFVQPAFWSVQSPRYPQHVGVSLVTAPLVEPVTLAEAQRQVFDYTPEADAELLGLITASRMYCESKTDMGFLPQTWRETFTRSPGLPLTLSKGPLQTSPTAPIVTYIDSAGDAQTLATTQYAVDAPTGPYAERGRLLPVYAPTVTPVTAYGMSNTFTVQYVVGFATVALVPMPVKLAMKLLIAFWFANRGDTDSGAWKETQQAVETLLQPFCREVLV